MLTTEQVRNRTKFVTRRLGWKNARPGELIQACVKCQGLKKGETVERLAVIQVVSVRSEPLCSMLKKYYGKREAVLEGFPDLSGQQFAEMFVNHNNCDVTSPVTRIRFRYV
jgi:hypothetical protein